MVDLSIPQLPLVARNQAPIVSSVAVQLCPVIVPISCGLQGQTQRGWQVDESNVDVDGCSLIDAVLVDSLAAYSLAWL